MEPATERSVKRVHSLQDMVSFLCTRQSCRAEDFYTVEDWSEFVDSPDIRFYCPLKDCGKHYKHKWGLLEHVKIRHNPYGKQKFECSWTDCGKRYSRLDGLRVHQKSEGHEGMKMVVEDADKVNYPPEIYELVKIAQGDGREEHSEEGESNLRYHCEIPGCSKSYSSKHRCFQHQLRSHGSPPTLARPFSCSHPGCSKTYCNKDGLLRHFKSTGHSDEHEKDTEKDTKDDSEERVQELVAFFDEI